MGCHIRRVAVVDLLDGVLDVAVVPTGAIGVPSPVLSGTRGYRALRTLGLLCAVLAFLGFRKGVVAVGCLGRFLRWAVLGLALLVCICAWWSGSARV